MTKFLGCAIVGLSSLLLTACTNYYEQQPEGYVSQTVPVGYTVAMIGGVSYWVNGGHYYRYWPNYGYVVVRPPYGRPPYQRPPTRPPTRPPHGGKPKPEHPIAKPPSTRPPQGRPPTIQPTPYPTTRPSGPSTRPSMPSTRPATRPMPSVQPALRQGGGKLRR